MQTIELATPSHAVTMLHAAGDLSEREQSMLKLIEDLIGEADAELENVMGEYDLSTADISKLAPAILGDVDNTVRLLNLLCDADITEADQLTRLVELPQKIIDLAESANS